MCARAGEERQAVGCFIDRLLCCFVFAFFLCGRDTRLPVCAWRGAVECSALLCCFVLHALFCFSLVPLLITGGFVVAMLGAVLGFGFVDLDVDGLCRVGHFLPCTSAWHQ